MPLPSTAASVFYAYTISVHGVEVGTLQNFSPTATRQTERIRQIMASTGTRVLEIVPGVTDTSLEVETVKLYRKNLAIAFGYNVYTIEDMIEPIDIIEEELNPTNEYTVVAYRNCVFDRWSETRSVGTPHIACSGSIQVSYVEGFRSS